MPRIAWWAAIALLIVESCTTEPVASLEAAGSMFVELPKPVNSRDYYQIAPRIITVGGRSDTLLFLFFRSLDSVWVYRLGEACPFGKEQLAIENAKPEAIAFDDVNRQVLVYCETSHSNEIRRFIEYYSYDLDFIRTDTLATPVDEHGYTYSVYSGPVYNDQMLAFSVSAQVRPGEDFRSKPCLAQYNLRTKSWRFVHQSPIEIQKDSDRFSTRPVIAAEDSKHQLWFFRYPLSDSIYRLDVSGVVRNVLISQSGIEFHSPVPYPPPAGWDPFTNEPFILGYYYLVDSETHVSLLKDRQPVRRSDGRLASLREAPCSLIFTRGNRTAKVNVPSGLLGFTPDPFIIGDRIAFARRSRTDEQAGRLTFSLFRMRLD